MVGDPRLFTESGGTAQADVQKVRPKLKGVDAVRRILPQARRARRGAEAPSPQPAEPGEAKACARLPLVSTCVFADCPPDVSLRPQDHLQVRAAGVQARRPRARQNDLRGHRRLASEEMGPMVHLHGHGRRPAKHSSGSVSICNDRKPDRNLNGTSSNLFDRVLGLKMTSHKAKSFFKKWLDLEKRIGDDEGIQTVKRKAMEWTQRAAATGEANAS